MSRSYLDHAATTPMVPEAVEAVTRELTRIGNASSLHASGRSARRPSRTIWRSRAPSGLAANRVVAEL